jgi:hypothetical protein
MPRCRLPPTRLFATFNANRRALVRRLGIVLAGPSGLLCCVKSVGRVLPGVLGDHALPLFGELEPIRFIDWIAGVICHPLAFFGVAPVLMGLGHLTNAPSVPSPDNVGNQT